MKNYILFLLLLSNSILKGQSDRILYYNTGIGGAAITDRSLNTLSGYNISGGWTSVVDLGSNRILYYNSNSGAAAITDYAINTLQGYNLSGGWTNVVNLGSNKILYYNSNSGAAAITDYSLNTLRGYNLSGGWTSVVDLGANRILYYNSNSGAAAITDYAINTLQGYNLSGGWTNVVNLGSNKILYYNKNSGGAAITDYALNTLGGYNLSGGWSSLTAFAIGGNGSNVSTRVMTRFNPSVHGFKFRNDFVSNFAGIDFYGLCGGMAYSALDYFNNNIPVPTQTSPPANGTPLRQYIYNRQQNSTLDNLDKWGELSFNPGNPFDGGRGVRTTEFFNWGLQGFNGGRVQELRVEIDANRPVPLGLYKGGNGGFVTHHQVLAIGYDMGRYRGDLGQYQEDLRIYVYDSNFPGQTKCLRPNLTNQTYYYESDPSCSWLTYFVDKKYRLASPPR